MTVSYVCFSNLPDADLPVGRLVPGVFGKLPLAARRGQRFLVAAIEQNDHACKRFQRRARPIGGRGAADQEQDLGLVRVLVFDGEIDRLARGMAVGRRAVRKKGLLGIRPEVRVERRHALGRAHAHECLPSPLARLLQQFGQHAFQRAPLEVVEEDFVTLRPLAGHMHETALSNCAVHHRCV